MPILRSAVSEVRGEIKEAATKLLRDIGKIVKCQEIINLSDVIINCLVDFGNLKLATDTLYKIANTTFLNYVDAASFALLFPIVMRAMKERAHESRKNGIMIVGACVVLIEDPAILHAYLPQLLPALQELALDPTFEIQREAAKAFGTLAKYMPKLLADTLYPWLLAKVESKDGGEHMSQNDRTGSAHSLSEVCDNVPGLMPYFLKNTVVLSAINGDGLFSKEKQSGAFSAIEFLCRVDGFERHVVALWPVVLFGLQSKEILVHEQALKAAQAVIHEFGGPKAQELLPALIDAVLTFDDEKFGEQNPRDMSITLLQAEIVKITEMKKYGQDLMTIDYIDMSSRLSIIFLLRLGRLDPDPAVRRISNLILKEGLQSSQKVIRDTIDQFMATLYVIKEGSNVKNKIAAAERCIKEAIDAGDVQADWEGKVDESKNVFLKGDFPWSTVETLTTDAISGLGPK